MTKGSKKLLIYGCCGVSAFIIACLIAGLVFRTGLMYAMFYGLLFAGLAVTLARTVYHLILKDYAPEMWQISIYMIVACIGWLGGILSLTWGWASLSLAVMVGAILMAVGTRFCKEVARAKTTSSLEQTLRYKFVDDILGGAPNNDAPLCLVNGTPMTVAEAEKAGAVEVAKKGREYIQKILGDR